MLKSHSGLALDQPHRRLWLAYAVLCASVLLHLAYYLIDHHSRSFLLLAAVIALFALSGIAVSVFVLRLPTDRLTALQSRVARGRDLYLAATLALALIYGIGMRPEWIYAHAGLMLGVGFALGYLLLYSDAPPLSRWWLIVAGAGAIVVTLIRIDGLSIYPVANINDEPWVLGWALSYVKHGTLSDTILFFGGQDVQRFILPTAWWIQVVGSSFWQTRLFFFMLIVPLTALTALAARSFYGSGWVAALFMLSSAVVMGGARIRDDIGLAIAVAACLWLYGAAIKRDRGALHFGAGLAIGLGWFAHYHAIGYGVALTIALYLPGAVERWRRGQRLPERGAWLFVIGGLAGAALVFAFQIVPDWAGFLAARQPRNPSDLSKLANVFFAGWSNIATFSQLELLLILGAIAAAIGRHRRSDVVLVLTALLMHFALAIMAKEPQPHYSLQISPVYGILVAGLFAEGMRGSRLRTVLATAALVLAINLGVTLRAPLDHLLSGAPLELPTPPVAAWIRANVSPTKRIVTEHWYYLWLTDYDFVSPLSPEYAPLELRQRSNAALWDQVAPDVVVIDRNLPTCCVPQLIYDTEYLQSRGYQEIAELPGDTYPILIYEKSGS